jgi:hypothetical protein
VSKKIFSEIFQSNFSFVLVFCHLRELLHVTGQYNVKNVEDFSKVVSGGKLPLCPTRLFGQEGYFFS